MDYRSLHSVYAPLRFGWAPGPRLVGAIAGLAALLSLAPGAQRQREPDLTQNAAELTRVPNDETAALGVAALDAPAADAAAVETAQTAEPAGKDLQASPRLGWEPRGVAGPAPVTFELLTVFALDEASILGSARPEESSRVAQVVPLPVPRPPEFQPTAPALTMRRAERQALRRQAAAAPSPAQVEDTRNFFEELFGIEKPATPALAYATLDNSAAEAAARRRVVPPPAPVIDSATAVYDISARSVQLPNGERLEAHSGLGEHMDDPRFVHIRMRGATPPGTYDLTEREALFHGVRAIRLTPVGGSEAVHGRVGLLAHTFMLGPSGASNGCVSFRDYDRFLQSYLRGEIRRLVVVVGAKQTSAPLLALR